MNAYRIPLWLFLPCFAAVGACDGGGGDGFAPSPVTMQLLDTVVDAEEGTFAALRIARSGRTSGQVSVDYATMDGTAVAGSDYLETNGTLTWEDGVADTQTVSIPIVDNDVEEDTRSFTLVLSNPQGTGVQLGGNSSATIDIVDNDAVVISAFGPISKSSAITVNGIQYNMDAADVVVNGQRAQQSELQPGQIISVMGNANLSTAMGNATEIGHVSTVIGPVEHIDAKRKRLIVMEQTVLTDAGTAFDPTIDGATFAGLTVGANVDISGFRNAAGEILASRIAPDPTNNGFQLIGEVSALDLTHLSFSLDRLLVDYRTARVIDLPDGMPVDGQLVLVRGLLSDGVLLVTEMAGIVDPTTTPGGRLLQHGVITRFRSPSDFDLNGFSTTTDANTRFVNGVAADLEANARITVDGKVTSTGEAVSADTVTFGRLDRGTTAQPSDL